MIDNPIIFEQVIMHLLRATHNVRLDCSYGGKTRKRQFDGYRVDWIPFTLTKVKIGIECKKLKRTVGIKAVEAFSTKLQNCKIDKGIMVSYSGFQSGAVDTAKESKIDLYNFRQCEIEDMDGEATQIDFETIERIDWYASMGFDSPYRHIQNLSYDVYTKDGKRIGTKDTIAFSLLEKVALIEKKKNGVAIENLSSVEWYIYSYFGTEKIAHRLRTLVIHYSSQQELWIKPFLGNHKDWYVMENIIEDSRRLMTRLTVERITNMYRTK